MTSSRRRTELNSASTVISVLLTGAFILQEFGVSPILDTSFEIIIGSAPPSWFSLALGATGTYAIFYQIVYVIGISPIECTREIDWEYDYNIDPKTLEKADFLNMYLVFLLYNYLLIRNGFVEPEAFFGGFLVIATSIIFDIVPRIVAKFIPKSCFWAVKIVIVSIPVSVILFIPTMLVISVG